MTTHTLFVATTPGLEGITAREIDALSADAGLPGRPGLPLGVSGTPTLHLGDLRTEAGGIALEGSLVDAFALNLHLRTASRVLVRLATFRAAHFAELEKHARRIDFRAWVAPDTPVEWAVTSRKSRLYHTEAIAERLAKAAQVDVAPTPVMHAPSGDGDGDGDGGSGSGSGGNDGDRGGRAATAASPMAAPRIVVRVVRDQFTVSLDTSGAHLHQRGDRVANSSAPLRETLAAALLLAAGWHPEAPLVDPMCGSGTIVIEAARMATARAPGLARTFALEQSPAFSAADRAAASELRARALTAVHPAVSPIVGRDRDPDAIAAARANINAAGLSEAITLETGAVSGLQRPEAIHDSSPGPDAPESPGLMATNPPWGLRLGDEAALRDLHAALGRVTRERFAGWGLAMITPSPKLAAAADRRLEALARFRQGGVNLTLWGRRPA